MINLVNNVLINFWHKFSNYLPDFFGGVLILIIGLVAASILKRFLLTILRFLKIERILEKTKLLAKGEVKIWEEVLTEILRWTVVILFLIPTLEVWGLSRATAVLNQFLFYLPNVIVAVIIAFIGLLASNLVADLVKHSIKTIGSSSANTLSVLAKGVIVFFTILIVLSQLGVAQDLIRILFTGIIAMLAIAGGLAFGLGGKDIAKDYLEELRKRIK
ncbi:hypothetical protein COS31_03670 [Candidatus Roizmanbacteria bacterium CG02_land_8_20_14_3_00_36_15]|uniref:Small-conductance mechanosensitive ion channel n=2 Tax=Candidatus Roizmaniibacteriota TaxID=1752723 RepID=A0A2M8KMG1_9BACT|nr:MAG: hypothetical protein COS51_03880 [Candidatus Roizmanbacteria bacterium CG03_land_8_20_14_0_80_36_21]PIV37661.1 MAG: hypothetical protein COS31_03670 [Candidatus Roizmanbacteria bacterium CG02_land_8_20_14_3_00_36_15]PIY69926.1 MAG: hypothetical protein COY89_03680 [Candidatus Roizmanbacteria bacterium CG_4_10_14_0_8_um_filter_36_36]PJA53491.1 MAG: hypothetical protein CO166_01740 [Candidatus Roizmanbacteria bacterium CG_4_9_14_3_um_filter_36_11]PJC82174.1 MAG: hypothetical protein CO007